MKLLHLLSSTAIALSLAGCAQSQTTPVAAPATTAQLMQQPNVVVLDVRTPDEYASGHLQNARNLDFKAADFSTQIAHLDTAKTYVLYCASGNRSGKAGVLMQQQGFRKVLNAGGFKTLKESGLKTE
ncbi:rhodanese-like domain-containing protein [Hymenobacter sp. GOD-10R]|uniref:rhodanese-like domain-containing protein n=1 Tax=Hymenobacter sp. GOD-10R TaxID=3093922 RepID=UPI002D79C866|nr:rhodanese-like domain-containing protein [Hymenobacter sp. GOD-10R]WRQ26419.1 rhodanese-like domain-containing protein [Hymenobacter sp. GOD-10R]